MSIKIFYPPPKQISGYAPNFGGVTFSWDAKYRWNTNNSPFAINDVITIDPDIAIVVDLQ